MKEIKILRKIPNDLQANLKAMLEGGEIIENSSYKLTVKTSEYDSNNCNIFTFYSNRMYGESDKTNDFIEIPY